MFQRFAQLRIYAALLLLSMGACEEGGIVDSTREPAAQQVASETNKKPRSSADYKVRNGGDLCSGKAVKRIKYDNGVHLSFGTFTVSSANSAGSSNAIARCWLELTLPAVPGWSGTIRRVGASGSAYIPQGASAWYRIGTANARVQPRPFTASGEFNGGWVKTQTVPDDGFEACGKQRVYPVGINASVSEGSAATTTITDLVVEVLWRPCTS